MTALPPDGSDAAIWKQRYRRPELSGLQVARGNRDQAIVLNDTTGLTQAYGLDLRSGAMSQLTDAPAGSVFAVLSRDGRHLFALDDVDGNEVGHWTTDADKD